jgi:hypothetical protein
MKEEDKEYNIDEWKTKFSEGEISESAAELAAKFMFAMSYYHERMKLHIMLHPLFFLAGFMIAFFAFGEM